MKKKFFHSVLTTFSLLACNQLKKDGAIKEKEDTRHLELMKALKLEDFCSSFRFLSISDDGLKEDLERFCNGDSPSPLFSDLIKGVWKGDKPFDSFTYQNIEELPEEKSSFLVGFAIKIPNLSPDQIRESNLNKALLMQVENNSFTLNVEQLEEKNGEGLNFLKILNRYKTMVKGPQSTEFRNERDTEINYYQVTSQREDLALSTEHLLKNEENKDYDWARTIVIIVGAPKSEKGSYLISTINFKTWNQGFHKINVRALEEITKLNAQATFDYLSSKNP